MRSADILALQRLRDRGRLTIPEAYNCGHDTLKGQGHGMHRLTSAGYVAFASWDPVSEDALWSITGRGQATLELLESAGEAPDESMI